MCSDVVNDTSNYFEIFLFGFLFIIFSIPRVILNYNHNKEFEKRLDTIKNVIVPQEGEKLKDSFGIDVYLYYLRNKDNF